MSTDKLVARTFSLAETCALVALVMAEWKVADAYTCFEEMGGSAVEFTRVVDRLTREGVLREHPRRRSTLVVGELFDALRQRTELVAKAVS